ncbi:MAG: hypothetical protein WCQ44_04585, partial [Opitutaceae bacterium]
LVSVLEAEGYGTVRRARLTSWKDGTTPVNAEQLLAMVADVGKGRLAGRLAKAAKDLLSRVLSRATRAVSISSSRPANSSGGEPAPGA